MRIIKRTLKKTIALVLCLIMAIGSFAYAAEMQTISAEVKDYEGHWAQTVIEKWLNVGKVSGYPDGSYKPDNNVTRAEFVKMVNGIIDFNKKAQFTFKDVNSTQWYYDYIGVAQAVGYISGYSPDKFGPNDYITREQAASILSRVQYLNNNAAGVQKYTDKNSISAWAAEAVGAASNSGFISGYTDGSFKPLKNLTRAEALTMIDNLLVNGKNYIVYNNGTELKDTVIKGDLIIAKTVGEGDVYLTNVSVVGEIKVFGGGMNSIYFKSVKAAKIMVGKDKVRLVFDDGSEVKELDVSSETIIENIDGTISKIIVADNNQITLIGKFDEVAITGDSDVVLDGAEINKLVVEQPIVIKGKGTIKELQANANGIKYEATVTIKGTKLGTGVAEKPVVIGDVPSGGGGGGGTSSTTVPVITIKVKSPDQDEKVFNTATFNSSTMFSQFLYDQVGSIIKSSDNLTYLNTYIGSMNDRLSAIKINGIDLYSVDGNGFDKAVNYLKATSIKNEVAGLKNRIIDSDRISLDDIKYIIDMSLYTNAKADKDQIIENFADFDNTIEYNDGSIAYTLTCIDGTTTITTNLISGIVNFTLNDLLYNELTVEQFFTTYGKVKFNTSYNSKESYIIIEKGSVIQ